MPQPPSLFQTAHNRPARNWQARVLRLLCLLAMGATLGALEERGLVERRPDPEDGRRAVMSLTDAGLEMLRNRRNARTEELAKALSAGFTPAECHQLMAAAPLIERLAQSI